MATSKKRVWWRVAFLVVTATALVMELWAALDGNADTDPWTDLIGDFVPWQLALAVFGALLLWVPVHFYVRYKREAREHAATQARLIRLEDKVQRDVLGYGKIDPVGELYRHGGSSGTEQED